MNDPKRILIVLLGLCLLSLSAFAIKGHVDSNGYKNQFNYVTAVQATDADHFNYAVDSQQGRVLASGKFSVENKDAVRFDEMNKSYAYVIRTKEHYTMHTRQVCTSNGKTTSCHTETYYTWDSRGSETKESPKLSLFGRSYATSLFDLSRFKNTTDCSEFMGEGSGRGWFQTKHGCLSGENYIDDDNRYVYETIPLNFSATFLATTYGGLKPFNDNKIDLQKKSISQTLHDVGQYKLIGFWVLIVVLFLMTVGACVLAYNWVMEDGVWSTDR